MLNSDWKFFQIPHFNPIHSSPITTILISTNLNEKTYSKIIQIFEEQQKTFNFKYFTKRKWPLKHGKNVLKNRLKNLMAKDVCLLLTGYNF